MRNSVLLVLLALVFTWVMGPVRAGEITGPAPTLPVADISPYDLKEEQAAWKLFRKLKNQARKKEGAEWQAHVLACMQDEDYRIRLLGIELVPKKEPGVKVVDKLLDLMKDKEWWVRENAGEKLYPVFSEKHLELVPKSIALCTSEWPSVRANAILALANVKAEGIVDAAEAMLEDPDAHVRAHCLMALGKQGGQRAEQLLVKAVTREHPHAWVTWYGLDGLKAMKAFASLRRLSDPKHKHTWKAAALGLMKLGETEVIPTVLKMATDSGTPLKNRSWAVSALKKAGYEGDLPEIPQEIIKAPGTPVPPQGIPENYSKPGRWGPRLIATDLGDGKVYLGWSVTAAPKRRYRVEAVRGKGWKILGETAAGSFIDNERSSRIEERYRITNEKEQVSETVRIVASDRAPQRPELVHIIRNDDHPVLTQTPGLLNWSVEWNVADLDCDGYLDFMVSQTAARLKKAYTWQGKLLWQRPYTRGSYWTHPVRTVAADLDGDGRTEMVCFEEDGDRKWLIVCDGITGEVQHYADMTKLTGQRWERRDKIILIDRTGCGREDTIVFMHNTYGNPQAVAFDAQLKHLWTYSSDWAKGHKTRIIDLDNDGKDEMILGGDCIDAEGTLLWKMPATTSYGHADFVDVRDLDPQRPGLEIIAAGCDSGGGWMMDWTGQLIWLQQRGHAQWLAAGRFGPKGESEIWIRRKKGDEIDDRVALNGERLGAPPLKGFGDPIDWDGDPANGDELLMHDGRVYNPATNTFLFNVKLSGRKRAMDIVGDSREEIVVINTDKRQIEIYTNPTVNPNPRPDRFDNGWWRYRSREKRPYGREYINPPS